MRKLIASLKEKPVVTRQRAWKAMALAVAADALQLLLGPAGWFLSNQVIDVVAMVLISRLVGFHVLLLPTFALELVPVMGMLPTWTGCVWAVIALRKRQQDPLAAAKPVDSHKISAQSVPPRTYGKQS